MRLSVGDRVGFIGTTLDVLGTVREIVRSGEDALVLVEWDNHERSIWLPERHLWPAPKEGSA